mmetsp:Transcript_24301/g.64144  ORF Transcript_24301/g.64144 Transcript_24301/m.64144 type:complete len:97 (+) Transcript_24301:3-293(+)
MIARDEFQMLLRDKKVMALADDLDIQVSDLDHLFETLQALGESDNRISHEEFVDGLRMMKHQAVTIDVLNVLRLCEQTDNKVTWLKERMEEITLLQ